jgi:hypothetical protein
MLPHAYKFVRRRAACTNIGWYIVLIGAATVAGIGGALASPPDNADPELAPWFQSLRAPNGSSCCSIADCRTTDYRTNGMGYEALIDGRWVTVPPERVLDHIANPTGRAVVCYAPALGILCFVRPDET